MDCVLIVTQTFVVADFYSRFAVLDDNDHEE